MQTVQMKQVGRPGAAVRALVWATGLMLVGRWHPGHRGRALDDSLLGRYPCAHIQLQRRRTLRSILVGPEEAYRFARGEEVDTDWGSRVRLVRTTGFSWW